MVSIITQNVKCFPEMLQEKVEYDVELTSEQADIVCWQEINIKRYVAAIEDLDGQVWDHYIDLKLGGAPISWKRELYDFVEGGSKVMYLGVAKISFTRKVVWVILRHKRTGELLAVVNAHFVAGAFKAGKSFPRIRKALWKRCRNVLVEKVSEFVNEGLPVIVCGDFNRHNFKVLGSFIEASNGAVKSIKYPVPSDSIDQIMLISGSELVFGEPRYTFAGGRYSDHQGRKVSVPLTRRKKS